jgi:hypothetical protein
MRVAEMKVRIDVVAAIAIALPVLLVRSPPMVDFAGHEAVVGVLRHWGEPAFLAHDVYRLNLGHPNQLQYFIGWLASLAVGPTKGLELATAVGVASIVLGAGRLAAHLRRPRWIALYAAPIALGFYFQWGNIANLLGTGLLLMALPDLDRFARAPRPGLIPGALLWCLVLYLAHEVALVVLCVLIACFALRTFTMRRALYCAIPCAFSFAMVLVQLRLQRLSPLNTEFMLLDRGAASRLLQIPAVIVGFSRDTAVTLLLFALTAVPLAIARLVRTRSAPPARDQEPIAVWPYTLVAVLLFVLYMALPFSYGGVFYFSHRFLPIAWVLLIVVAFRADTEPPRVQRFAAYAIPVAMLATSLPSFLATDASYRELDSLLGGIEPGSAVASIELDPVQQGAINADGFSARMVQGHVLAMKGGRALFDYTQSPISPARLRPSKRWDRMIITTFLDPVSIRPRAAMTHFRYLIVHSVAPAVLAATVDAVSDVARVVAAGSTWVVFESTEDLVAVDAPEGVYAEPLGDTLRESLQRAFARAAPAAH